LSKPAASRGSVCAFCTILVLAVVALALLVFSPRRVARSTAGSVPGIASQPLSGASAARGRVQANYAALPLAFEQNRGQTDAQVKYLARGNGYVLFLTSNDAVFSLRSRSPESAASKVRRDTEINAKNISGHRSNQKDSSAVVRMHLVGANSSAKVAAIGQLPGKSNYFLGSDPSKWRTDVPRYARVSYQDVYPGVDMTFHGAQRQFEFDFVVAPGANPTPIGLHLTGAQSLKTDESGNLVVSSVAGDVLLHKPVAYQEQNGKRRNVDAQFVLKASDQVSFALGNYDRARELVIDPSVSYAYSTYLGGTGDDEGFGIAFDGSGNAYVTGQTASTDFPVVAGGLAPNSLLGVTNAFVTKISPGGSSPLVYSTYVGGTGSDSGNAIAVDSSGEAFVAGGTSSTDFPHTNGAFQTSLGSGSTGNAFVFELNSTGNALIYGTYLGGSGPGSSDVVKAMAIDSSKNVYVVGRTSSTDFPVQAPLQASLAGTSNGFVTKLASGGASLVFSTYLGGGTGDYASGVAVDSSGNVYVTGGTSNGTFPTTAGAFQPKCGTDGNCNGLSDAFVTVINAAGSGYVYSTFLGGSGIEAAAGIAVDASGNAYVTGSTTSTDFPLKSALQGTYGGDTDAFVTKLNAAGNALVYSTYLGGSQPDGGAYIAVDGGNNAYVTGQTESSPFPTSGATQTALGGGNDAFVAEINSAGALAFSTYLGGSLDEDGTVGNEEGAIAVDPMGGSIYVTGNTTSSDFPPSSAFQSANAGGSDAFVVKYTQVTFNLAAATPAAVSPGTSATSMVTLTSVNSYASPVNLTCSVSGGGTPAPACSASSFSPASPITPSSTGAPTTLTITTTGPSASNFTSRKLFYAMWIPIAGISLVGMSFGSARSRRKKLLGFLMIAMVVAALFIMPACGGSSNSGGGGGGGGGGNTGTPAGAYTVTITGTGTDASATTQSAQVTLTVN
jgi:Beta-propeller repeat